MEKQKKQTIISISQNEHGKLPPQATELEEIVLAALIVEKDAIEKIELEPIDFYKTSHQTIYTAIIRLRDKHNPIDMFTVVDELKRMNELDNIGGAYAITMLSMKVSSASNIVYHSNIIKQKSIARKLISLSSEVQQMAFNEETDVADVLEFMEQNFTDISTGSTHTDASDISTSISDTIEYMQKLQFEAENGRPSAIPTGLSELDKQLNGGWKAPDLIVLGGRPSMGKTQFAVKFSKEATLAGYPTLFVSIEMTKIQLLIRMITENDRIDFYKIKTGQLNSSEWAEVDKMVNDISKLDLFIADDFKIKYLNNIKSLARKYKRQGKLSLLIIDYLGLIETNGRFGNRDLEIGYITRELKSLCKELNVPTILLSQLKRAEPNSKVRRPILSDLRESGNIEQDADIVIFPHRPHYYDSEAVDSEGVSWEHRGELVIGKHREGEINAIVKFKHDKSFKKIFDDEYLPKKIFTENINAISSSPNLDFYSSSNSQSNNDVPF